MREILFRGKRVDNGECVYGDLLNLHNGDKYIVNNKFGACIDDKGNFINTESPFVCKVIPETVGQFTGVLDENGKKIFEGDIVQIGKDEEYDFFFRKGVVEFGEGTFDSGVYRYTGFYFREKDGTIDHNTIYKPDEEWGSDIFVIGNIHDNPELFRGDKNGKV